MNAAGKRNGFTLVELLVVIGIIAILISFLMPTLRRARDSANRTACLSNLRQIAAYLQQYQNQYDGELPVYFTPAYLDKAIYVATLNGSPPKTLNDYTNLGLLVPANIAPQSGSQTGRVFYCPGQTFQHGQLRPFNTQLNPWVGKPGFFTRINYSMRPEYWVWNGTAGNYWKIQYPNMRFDMDRQTDADDAFIIPPSNMQPKFPRAGRFNRKNSSALMTDLIDADATLRRLIHRGSWNVLYENWSVKCVPEQYFTAQLKKLEQIEVTAPGTPATRRAMFDLWQELDRY